MNKDKMKLIIAIISSSDANKVQTNLNKENLSNTRLATKGGFLREKNATFIIGLSEDQLEKALKIIKKHSQTKTQLINNNILNKFGDHFDTQTKIIIGGATVFILNIENFLKI
ncbi:cyclic-di-AMP receptor [Candidatus Phytoplasma palmae]|uniref:cyclic-di-AMP receptor n=1 Tax=Candidatus Phytoplasma palmae TaxID=85624 RepID=UPI003990C3BD